MRGGSPLVSTMLASFLLAVSLEVHSETTADEHQPETGTETGKAKECTVRDSTDAVVVVICPRGMTREEWRSAGLDACSANRGICNAWIWDDADLAPEQAPVVDSDLSEDEVRRAVAVWVNDAERLMILRQVKE